MSPLSFVVLLGPTAVSVGFAPHAVVRRDVPPYAVVSGNPAEVVRPRVGEGLAARLLALRWWDWPPEVVAGAWRRFTEPVEAFVAWYDPASELGEAP